MHRDDLASDLPSAEVLELVLQSDGLGDSDTVSVQLQEVGGNGVSYRKGFDVPLIVQLTL